MTKAYAVVHPLKYFLYFDLLIPAFAFVLFQSGVGFILSVFTTSISPMTACSGAEEYTPVLRTPSYIKRCSVLRLSFCFLLHLCFLNNTLYRKSRLISLGNQAAVYRIFIFGTKSDHPHGDNVCAAVDCA